MNNKKKYKLKNDYVINQFGNNYISLFGTTYTGINLEELTDTNKTIDDIIKFLEV